MKKNCFMFAVGCLSALFLLMGCTPKFPGYEKTADGLYYKFYSQNPSASQPKVSEKLEVKMACYLHDSLYYDFQQSSDVTIFTMNESFFPGDLMEAFSMMHVGDSASFMIKADSVAKKYYGLNPDPLGLKADDYFRYEVKLMEIRTIEQLNADKEEAMQLVKAEAEKAFLDYLKANQITDHTDSGLFYSKLVSTKGETPQLGQTARIKYEVSYLDGTHLGSSDDLGKYFDIPMGMHQVLPGLEEGVGLMHLGEKVRFVLPYTLAYGENAYKGIPPYSNLIFDVELIDILNETK